MNPDRFIPDSATTFEELRIQEKIPDPTGSGYDPNYFKPVGNFKIMPYNQSFSSFLAPDPKQSIPDPGKVQYVHLFSFRYCQAEDCRHHQKAADVQEL